MRIVHMTTVHPWNDVRIFYKMCRSLANDGHDVHLIAPRSGQTGRFIHNGVHIHSVPMPGNRGERIFSSVNAVLKKASSLDADIYHFHDPEFLTRAVSFQKKVARPVVYDVHEDIRLQVFNKKWLPPFSRALISKLAGTIEDRSCGKLAAVVASTPGVAKRFSAHKRCIVVQNYPRLEEFRLTENAVPEKVPNRFVYVGGISEARGIREMQAAATLCGNRAGLVLAGKWASSSLQSSCQSSPAWSHVEDRGFLDRTGICSLLHSARAGLVLIHPRKNYLEAYPIKLFEYMAAGLPVIASDFPLLRRIIVEEARCGLVADPLDPESISRAMNWILDHPHESLEMGLRGKQQVTAVYNWDREFVKLKNLYDQLGQSR